MHNSKDNEKSDYVDESGIQTPDDDPSQSNIEEDLRLRRIKRKVDFRLSAILALMYIVNQIDVCTTNLQCNVVKTCTDSRDTFIANQSAQCVSAMSPERRHTIR
jgi:hypothetical protein